MKLIVPIYPWPVHPVVQAQLDKIDNLMVVEAVPGSPGPILAIRKLPPFICDAILVTRPERLESAVQVVAADGVEMVSMRETVATALAENGQRIVVEERVEVVAARKD